MMIRPPLSGTTVCYPLGVSSRFTLERALQGFSYTDLKCVELVAIPGYCEHLMPDHMGQAEIDATKLLLDKYKIVPVVLNAAADLTVPEGVTFLGHAMRVAHALGIKVLVAGLEQTETEQGEARFRQLVPRIIALADRYDVVLALETHGGLINTGVEGVALLKEIGSERLKLTYDMANVLYYGGVLPADDLGLLKSDIGRYIAHVHLKDKANMKLRDYDFPTFGTGILHFGPVLELLYAGGYRGVLTLEVELDGHPESPELVDEALVHSYEYLRRFWSN